MRGLRLTRVRGVLRKLTQGRLWSPNHSRVVHCSSFLVSRLTPFEADKKGHSVDDDVADFVVDRLDCKLKRKH